MKVLMVDVDGVLIHGRPADGLPLFTYLERDPWAAPGEIGFIDDTAENIEAARQFGWNAAQWTAGTTLAGAFPALRRPA